MWTSSNYSLHPVSEEERNYLESLIREDFERCHPGDTLDDLKRRASFSREDKGLLRDWMAIACHSACNIGSDAILVQLTHSAPISLACSKSILPRPYI